MSERQHFSRVSAVEENGTVYHYWLAYFTHAESRALEAQRLRAPPLSRRCPALPGLLSKAVRGERSTRNPALACPAAFEAVPAPWQVHSPDRIAYIPCLLIPGAWARRCEAEDGALEAHGVNRQPRSKRCPRPGGVIFQITSSAYRA